MKKKHSAMKSIFPWELSVVNYHNSERTNPILQFCDAKASNSLLILPFSILLSIILSFGEVNAQEVLINNEGGVPVGSAQLEVESNNKGVLIPRLTTAQMNAISSPATGLLIFNSTVGSFYFYNGSAWVNLSEDNLGDHQATQNVQLNGNYLSNDGGNEGIRIDNFGKVGIGTTNPSSNLHLVDTTANVIIESTKNPSWAAIRLETPNSNFSVISGVDTSGFMIKDNTANVNRLVIDSFGLVGVGTKIPTAKLTVVAKGPANASAGQVQIDDLSGNSMMLGRNNSYGFLQTQNSQPLTLNPLGNRLGVGLSNPTTDVHFEVDSFLVKSPNSFSGSMFLLEGHRHNAGNFIGQFRFQNTDQTGTNTLYTAAMLSSENTGGNNSGDLRFYTSANTVLSPAMIIDTNQKVGIGTPVPFSKLHVEGTTDASLSSDGLGLFGSKTSSNIVIDANEIIARNNGAKSRLYLQNDGGDFSVGNNKLYVTDAGTVGLGSTAPTNELHIVSSVSATDGRDGVFIDIQNSSGGSATGSATTTGIRFKNNSGNFENSYTHAAIMFQRTAAAGRGNLILANKNTGNAVPVKTSDAVLVVTPTQRIGIGTAAPSHLLHVNGTARSTSSTWATTSDLRAKTNIIELDSALSKLLLLRPVSFDWNETYLSQHPSIKKNEVGFISQEVEVVFPEMITEIEEVLGSDTIPDFKLLNKDALFPLLVKSIQEQQQLIEYLRMTIEDLRLENGDLKSNIQDQTSKIEYQTSKIQNQQSEINSINAKLEEQHQQILIIQKMLNDGMSKQ